ASNKLSVEGFDNAQIIHVHLKTSRGSLEDIPRLDTSKSNTYTLKEQSIKRGSTIKPKVPNVRRTYHLCAALTFKSKTVKFALTQQSVENSDLNAQLQEKAFAIATLKNELRKLKGKNIIDTTVSKPSATIAPTMLKLDIEPISQ
ncbi:hypothetical protein Tco_1162417, partial [Tanacetum coccineum]